MKRFFKVVCIISIALCLIGCKQSQKENINDISATKENLEVAIYAGENNVYIDEARYYAYNTQATYEAYYLTEEKKLNWSEKNKNKTSFQSIVKATVLDGICRRECLYSLAEEYNVSLDEDELTKIDADVNNFIKNSNKKLINKINITKERLTVVFSKDKIAQKVEDIMNATDKNLVENTYKKWKEEHTVSANQNWEKVNYNEPIFTAEDMK